jgi:undecaprenyl-diphosphatase
MSWLESLVLGLIQGFTEYLPISSSGHLAIMSSIFGIDGEQNLKFTVLVHIATVLSTLVILNREIMFIFRDLFKRQSWNSYKNLNEGTQYAIKIIVSMIPIGFVGVFFKDTVEEVFGSGLMVVGVMLLFTALLLIFSYFAKPREKENISIWHAFIIGISQAVAVFPGLSRSGTTISTGLLLGNKKEKLAQFSFLMVIPPILGEALLDIIDLFNTANTAAFNDETSFGVLSIGFIAAFLAGCAACKWMISIVRKGKLIYFGIYCAIIGLLTLILS